MIKFSDRTQRKVQLYFAANYLYEIGQSHPQVIEYLNNYESDSELITSIADQAQFDVWRKVFTESQRLTAEGMNFEEIITELKKILNDQEIVEFIYRHWYEVKVNYAECLIESETNISENIPWIIISSLGTFAVYYLDASIFQKIIWPLCLAGSLFVYFIGIYQKRLAKRLEKILNEDYTRFDKLF